MGSGGGVAYWRALEEKALVRGGRGGVRRIRRGACVFSFIARMVLASAEGASEPLMVAKRRGK